MKTTAPKMITKMRTRSFPMNTNKDFVENTWALLKNAIQEIQKKNSSELSFGELYYSVYRLVLHKSEELLYNGLKEVVTDHLLNNVKPKILNSINDNLLKETIAAWNDHQTAMGLICDIFMYLDRTYVKKNNLEPIYNSGLTIFRDQVIRCTNIRDNLRDTLQDMVMKERKGEIVDHITIKNACQMLMCLGNDKINVYDKVFECPF